VDGKKATVGVSGGQLANLFGYYSRVGGRHLGWPRQDSSAVSQSEPSKGGVLEKDNGELLGRQGRRPMVGGACGGVGEYIGVSARRLKAGPRQNCHVHFWQGILRRGGFTNRGI